VHNKHTGRMQLRLSVEVHKEKCLLGHFVTRDIDQAGVFIEATKLDVHPDDILKLMFLHAEPGSREYILRATVMRVVSDGIGLAFLEGDDNALAALMDDKRIM
jgi:hypothetical protein